MAIRRPETNCAAVVFECEYRWKENEHMQRLKNKLNLASSTAITSIATKKEEKFRAELNTGHSSQQWSDNEERG